MINLKTDIVKLTDEYIHKLQENIQCLTNRKNRIFKQAPICPKCRTKQVELINLNPLAKWKCRCCKHIWRYEPLVKISK